MRTWFGRQKSVANLKPQSASCFCLRVMLQEENRPITYRCAEGLHPFVAKQGLDIADLPGVIMHVPRMGVHH